MWCDTVLGELRGLNFRIARTRHTEGGQTKCMALAGRSAHSTTLEEYSNLSGAKRGVLMTQVFLVLPSGYWHKIQSRHSNGSVGLQVSVMFLHVAQ